MDSNLISKIIMNPVRMRIVQYLLLNETGTVTQIGEELNDIPKASLYRHIKVLENAELILIVQENRKRGTIEKVYKLNQESPLGKTKPTQEEVYPLIQAMLLGILGDFQNYFTTDGCDLMKDMLSVSSSTLLLSDEEYLDFSKKIGEIYNGVIYNKPTDNRKPRRITLISSPITNNEDD